MSLGVAVSGGADSIALLYILAEQRRDLIVLHVNHGLRGEESEADQHFVFLQAATLDLPCLAYRADPPLGNLEQFARHARYAWFHRLIRDGTVTQVATGHTEDDQAETVLFRFLRGAGTAGLAAILPQTTEGIVRPLLNSTRGELREYLEFRKIAWREDSSNHWLRFSRNRLRKQLIPQLERDWNPKLTAALAQMAYWAQSEEEYWAAVLLRLRDDWLCFGTANVTLPAAKLNALPVAAARRVIRYSVQHAAGSTLDLNFSHVEQVLALARSPGKMASFRKRHWEARFSLGQLRIAGSHSEPPSYRKTVTVPDRIAIPRLTFQLELELITHKSVYNNDGELVDWALVSGSLELRNWVPGDRFHQAGHQTPRKLKYFFQEAGIPSWERSGWPVLTCDNSIFWTRRLGVALPFLPTSETKILLRITERPCE